MSHFCLSSRAPIMGDGWVGPGARSSAMNDDANRMYAAIKAQVEREAQQKREAENEKRAEKGLPPLEEKKPSIGSRALNGLKKML